MSIIPCHTALLKANPYYGFGTNNGTTAYIQATHRHCYLCGQGLTRNTLCFWFQSGQTPPQFGLNHGTMAYLQANDPEPTADGGAQ